MTWVGYRLIAKSPFHLGERGIGLEETSLSLHADTLFSALCLTLRETGIDLSALLGQFPQAQRCASGMQLKTCPHSGLLQPIHFPGQSIFSRAL
jgi:CRISPR/Cas system CSM-associated protein Csm4 (group 5 of RAMP superfamily)